MKKIILLIMALLLLPICFAENNTSIIWSNIDQFEPNYQIPDINQKINISEEIKLYCSTINNRLIILLAVVFAFWLFEPGIKKFIDKLPIKPNPFLDNNTLKFMYKFIGLGLLFLAGLLIYVMNRGA